MSIRKCSLILLFTLITFLSYAQSLRQYFLYSYNRSIFNPAEAGADDRHIFSLHGRYFTPTTAGSAVINYEGPSKRLHGGIGVMGMSTRAEYYRLQKVGISYNYKYEFNEETSVRIGARPALNRYQEEDYYNMPLPPSTFLTIDFGAFLSYHGFYFGSWFANPGRVLFFEGGASTSINILAGKKIKLGKSVETDPSLLFAFNGGNDFLLLNNNLVIKNWLLIGANLALDLRPEGTREVALNGGVTLFKKVDIIGVIWSSRFKDIIEIDPVYYEAIIRVRI